MATLRLVLKGRRSDIEAFLDEAGRNPEIKSLETTDVSEPIGTPAVLSRKPQHQFEIYELAVSFLINLAASVTYDVVKTKLISSAKKREISTKEIDDHRDDES